MKIKKKLKKFLDLLVIYKVKSLVQANFNIYMIVWYQKL